MIVVTGAHTIRSAVEETVFKIMQQIQDAVEEIVASGGVGILPAAEGTATNSSAGTFRPALAEAVIKSG